MPDRKKDDRADAPDLEAALLVTVSELSRELLRSPPPRVSLDSSFERDLGIDSLGRVELISRVEDRFDVVLPEAVLTSADTPRDLVRALTAARARRAPVMTPLPPAASVRDAEPAPATAETLADVLAWHAARQGQRVHIRLLKEDGEETITYGELQREAQAVAAGLQGLGIEPGQSVAIMLPTSRAYFAGFFGVVLAGAIPVPIYPPTRASQLEDHVRRHGGILANAVARLLITVAEAKPVARLLRAQVDTLTGVCTVEELSGAQERFRPPPLAGADTAFLQYTSGSTGNPKGVILTHANLLANIRVMGETIGANPADVFVSWLPLYHDMGLIGAWLGPLYYAASLVVMSPLAFLSRPGRWLQTIHQYRGTLSASPNFGYELCLRRVSDGELNGLDLSSMRLMFNGAEAISPTTMERFCERFARFGFRREAMTPVYGLAECTLGLAFPPLDRGPLIDRVQRETFMKTRRAKPAAPDDHTALRFVTCGQPLPRHEIRIIDEAGRELPERHEGRLQFRGPSVTSGYFRNPEATKKLYTDNWLDSGDLAYIANGEVYVTGRLKDVIIRAGRNIYPEEIEEAVGDLAGIRKGRVAVFGSQDPESGTERLVVLAETREEDAAMREALVARTRERVRGLAGTVPDDVCLAPPQTVLKTSSGKIRRAASRNVYEQGAIGRAPRTAVGQILRLAARSVLPEVRRVLSRAASLLYAAYAWVAFALLAPIAWALVVTLPKPALRWAVLHRMARVLARTCGVRIAAQGLENLPPPQQPCVLVVNHASYLDGYALVAALPRSFSFVAKAEFRRSFVAGPFLRRLDSEFVERFDRKQGIADARRLAQSVGAGHWLTFFPEGTFTRAPGLLPFHLGAFVAAAEASVPVVPITLRGTRSILREGSWFPRRGAIGVTVGKTLDPDNFRQETTDAWSLALRLRDAARAEILRTSHEPDLTAGLKHAS